MATHSTSYHAHLVKFMPELVFIARSTYMYSEISLQYQMINISKMVSPKLLNLTTASVERQKEGTLTTPQKLCVTIAVAVSSVQHTVNYGYLQMQSTGLSPPRCRNRMPAGREREREIIRSHKQ